MSQACPKDCRDDHHNSPRSSHAQQLRVYVEGCSKGVQNILSRVYCSESSHGIYITEYRQEPVNTLTIDFNNPYQHDDATILEQLNTTLQEKKVPNKNRTGIKRPQLRHVHANTYDLSWVRLGLAAVASLLGFGQSYFTAYLPLWMSLPWVAPSLVALVTVFCLWPTIQACYAEWIPMVFCTLSLALLVLYGTNMMPIWGVVALALLATVALLSYANQAHNMQTAQLLSLTMLFAAQLAGLMPIHWCHFLLTTGILLLGHQLKHQGPSAPVHASSRLWHMPLYVQNPAADSKPGSPGHIPIKSITSGQVFSVPQAHQDGSDKPYIVVPVACTTKNKICVETEVLTGQTNKKLVPLKDDGVTSLQAGDHVYADDKTNPTELTFTATETFNNTPPQARQHLYRSFEGHFTVIMLLLTGLAGAYAWFMGHAVVMAMCSMLLCACPCCVFGLGPNMIRYIAHTWLSALGIHPNAKRAIMLDALEDMHAPDEIILDKTGTLFDNAQQIRTGAKQLIQALKHHFPQTRITILSGDKGNLSEWKNIIKNELKGLNISKIAYETAQEKSAWIHEQMLGAPCCAHNDTKIHCETKKHNHTHQACASQRKKILYIGDGLNDSRAWRTLRGLCRLVAFSMPASSDAVAHQASFQLGKALKSPLKAIAHALSVAKWVAWLNWVSRGLTCLYLCTVLPVTLLGYVTPMTACLFMCTFTALVALGARAINQIGLYYLQTKTLPYKANWWLSNEDKHVFVSSTDDNVGFPGSDCHCCNSNASY